MSDPEEITIVVHSASGLQGKKPGRHKYSVIFGLGGTKFRTAVVKDSNGNPDWNEETVLHVSNILDQVFIIVTEKDDILGQITIPVSSLRAQKGQAKRTALQSHKKCPNPKGELVYQCYVSKYRPPGEHVPIIKQLNQAPDSVRSQSAFQRLRKRMASPTTQRRNKYEGSNKDSKESRGSLGNFNKKFSRSITDLFSFGKVNGLDDTEDKINTSSNSKKTDKYKGKRKFSLSFLSVSNNLDQAGDDAVITSVTPNIGPIDRPIRLTIEGKNLGFGKSDIMSIKVAGCDCTDTIEYESSSKLYCTTHFWKVCKGAVIVETISGGIATLKDGYTFYEELDSNENSTNPFDSEDDLDKVGEESVHIDLGGKEIKSGSNTIPRIKSSFKQTPEKSPVTSTPVITPGTRYQKKHQRNNSETVIQASNQPPVEHVSKEQLMEKIALMQIENAALKKDNVEMRAYIDKLVAKCMMHCPEALAADDDEKSKLYVL